MKSKIDLLQDHTQFSKSIYLNTTQDLFFLNTNILQTTKIWPP